MKTTVLLLQVTCALAATAASALAQGDSGNRPGPGTPPPPSPVVLALDADNDQVISAAEIAASATSLLDADANSDGQLTPEEFGAPKGGKRGGNDSAPPPARAARNGGEGAGAGPRDGRRGPHSPLIEALDADKDRVISATEIANAPAALATLDADGNGSLSCEEFAPMPPRGGRGAGGPPQD